MACSYDTQTVLEMLFDIDSDNALSDSIYGDHDSSWLRVQIAQLRVHFSIYT